MNSNQMPENASAIVIPTLYCLAWIKLRILDMSGMPRKDMHEARVSAHTHTYTHARTHCVCVCVCLCVCARACMYLFVSLFGKTCMNPANGHEQGIWALRRLAGHLENKTKIGSAGAALPSLICTLEPFPPLPPPSPPPPPPPL